VCFNDEVEDGVLVIIYSVGIFLRVLRVFFFVGNTCGWFYKVFGWLKIGDGET